MKMPWEISEAALRAKPAGVARPKKKRRPKKKMGGPDLTRHVGKPCVYCGAPMHGDRYPTRDHVHPRRLGGTLHPENVLIVCGPCNGHKGGLTLEQFAGKLMDHGDPRAPRVWELVERREPFTPAAVERWEARRRAEQIVTEPGQPKGPAATPFTPVPYADSMYILRHGKKAWRAMKETAPPAIYR